MSNLVQLASTKVVRVIVLSAVILLVPLIAMQFTDEVVWTASDFVNMGVLLLGFGLVFEGLMTVVQGSIGRIAVSVTLAVLLMTIWAEIAVGLFD